VKFESYTLFININYLLAQCCMVIGLYRYYIVTPCTGIFYSQYIPGMTYKLI